MKPISGGPAAAWQALLESDQLSFDPAQASVVEALQQLYIQLQTEPEGRQGLLTRLFKPQQSHTPVGLYIWGDVGRGKTMLMDLFYNSLPANTTIRLHFHRFMQRTHVELRKLDGQQNPLQTIAGQWSQNRVICFDEFYISDIADAMLLGELMKALFSEGVVLVATSNTAPQNLYTNGLQRARFLPAIAAIEKHCKTLHLNSDTDYRLRILKQFPVYHSPLNSATELAISQLYEKLNPGSDRGQLQLQINSRNFTARHRGDGIIWFEFAELCEKPRGSIDYIEIARIFNTVMITGLPVFTDEKTDSLRRFITLVDELYDRGVNLVLSAAADLDNLYLGKRLVFEFRRTYSRLNEMQTQDYLAQAHRP
ncbi:MAG: AFG1 family ATPase [Xanthomonadales bacterium]|nr:AFG1 family ATPase [Xanthomonadales bacterium]